MTLKIDESGAGTYVLDRDIKFVNCPQPFSERQTDCTKPFAPYSDGYPSGIGQRYPIFDCTKPFVPTSEERLRMFGADDVRQFSDGDTVVPQQPIVSQPFWPSEPKPETEFVVRDTFAAAALTGLLASGVGRRETLAKEAFEIADQMMQVRG